MIKPNFIDKLLDWVEVEWNSLGEVGEFTRGKRFVKTDMLSEGFPCIHYGEMYTHYNIWAETTKSFVSHDLASKLRVANHGDVVIVAAGETIEDIGKGTAWLGNTGVVIHDACFSYRSSLNPKYVSYFLRTKHFHDQIKKYISSGKISAINANGLSKAQIPIPPLKVQEEIVRILDTFTELTAELTVELTAELTARKKQYEYYRDKLLAFEEGEVEWKALGEEFPFIRNGFVGTVTPFFTDEVNGVRYLQGTNIHNGVISDNTIYHITKEFHQKCSRTELKADDILMVQSGHVGESAVVGEKYKGSNCHALIVMSNGGKCNSKFVNYYFQSTEGKKKLQKITTGETIKHILASKMKKFPIPIPPLEEQERIVSILDKFDPLTSSITEGLTREIELRQKQYEYYRNMLLSFQKEEVEK